MEQAGITYFPEFKQIKKLKPQNLRPHQYPFRSSIVRYKGDHDMNNKQIGVILVGHGGIPKDYPQELVTKLKRLKPNGELRAVRCLRKNWNWTRKSELGPEPLKRILIKLGWNPYPRTSNRS